MKKYISIDIGGTAIKYGIVSENAEVLLKKEMKTGIPYAAAVEKILAEHIPQSSFSLKEPNTILAIEYLRAIEKLNASFTSIAIKRKKSQSF